MVWGEESTKMAEGSLNGHPIPRHVAVIMDGNGRWASQYGLPRLAGHRAGTENIRPIVRTCTDIGVQYLTLYAFSTENWRRPSLEVEGLMRILSDFIDRETQNLHDEGIHLRHLGTMEGVNELLKRKVHQAVDLTRNNTRLTLAIAFNYGGRADILQAIQQLVASGVPIDAINEEALAAHLSTNGMPDPDLIIRTSGEWRLSNFLIWEAAYSEYWTTPVFWPDFKPDHFRQAISDYVRRERRFGGVLQ